MEFYLLLPVLALLVILGDAVIHSTLLWKNVGMLAALAYALMVAAWVGWIENPPTSLVFGARWAGKLSYGIYLFHNAAPTLLACFWKSFQATLSLCSTWGQPWRVRYCCM